MRRSLSSIQKEIDEIESAISDLQEQWQTLIDLYNETELYEDTADRYRDWRGGNC